MAAINRKKNNQTFFLPPEEITHYYLQSNFEKGKKKVKVHHIKLQDLTATNRKHRREESIEQYNRDAINKV